MSSSDYLWVVIDRKKTRSKSKKCHKSPALHKNQKIKVNTQQHEEENKRMSQLQKQNRILRKENAVLREYFYTKDQIDMRKASNIPQEYISKKSSVRESRSYRSEEKGEKAQATTVYSQENKNKKFFTFGNSLK